MRRRLAGALPWIALGWVARIAYELIRDLLADAAALNASFAAARDASGVWR